MGVACLNKPSKKKDDTEKFLILHCPYILVIALPPEQCFTASAKRRRRLVVRTDLNTKDGMWFRKFLERTQNQPHHIDAWHLRKTCAILILDARSDIPEIDVKKYSVPGKKRPIFDSFKNTKPPVGGLFYEIDEQNKGEDGFLHITYSGEENFCGSNEEQEHGDKISFENENSQEAANNPHVIPVHRSRI